VVKLPSGEKVALAPVQRQGHLTLRITAPEGSTIDHRQDGDDIVQEIDVAGQIAF
jgi:hypothetical protein